MGWRLFCWDSECNIHINDPTLPPILNYGIRFFYWVVIKEIVHVSGLPWQPEQSTLGGGVGGSPSWKECMFAQLGLGPGYTGLSESSIF